MEDNGTPPWARELRDFTELSLGRLEARLSSRIDGLDSRMTAFESRVIRKIDDMGASIDEKFSVVDHNIALIQSQVSTLHGSGAGEKKQER